MGQCKKCGTIITDNNEYCEACKKEIMDFDEMEMVDSDVDLDEIDMNNVDISDFDLEGLNLDGIDLDNLSFEDVELDNDDMIQEEVTLESQEDLGNQLDKDMGIEEEILTQKQETDNNMEDETSLDDILNVLNFENDNSDTSENEIDELNLESLNEETGSLSSDLGQEEFGLNDVLDGFDGLGDLFSEEEKATSLKDLDQLDDGIDEDILNIALEEDGLNQESKEQKKGIISRLFGNVKDSKWEKEKQEKEEEEAKFKEEEEEKQKEEKAEKEEKEEQKKKEKEEKKAEKLAAKKTKKEEKERVKKERKELQKEIVEEDIGRINRVGTAIIFCFFSILAIVIVLGTNLFSYQQGIDHATKYFETKKYNKAYEKIRGLEIKEKDNSIYQKIMTVMYVNKELNSFNNYYNSKMYPQALDSLLKGLERYDKYLPEAEELEIRDDLDYVKRNIVKELGDAFELSEEKANVLIKINSTEEYTEAVIKIVANN